MRPLHIMIGTSRVRVAYSSNSGSERILVVLTFEPEASSLDNSCFRASSFSIMCSFIDVSARCEAEDFLRAAFFPSRAPLTRPNPAWRTDVDGPDAVAPPPTSFDFFLLFLAPRIMLSRGWLRLLVPLPSL